MSIHAESRPLETPLPGGSDGATVTVEPMVTGTFSSPPILHDSPKGKAGTFAILRSTRKEREPNPIPCFLIRHPSAGLILVDTGLHPSIASDPASNLGKFTTWLMRPHQEPGQDVLSRLREKGISPSDIRMVIFTHLHYDHASAISEFPDSTLIVNDVEWKYAATVRSPDFKGYRRQQFDYAFDFRTISFDSDKVGSYVSFGRTLDLFGDGSIRLASTPGHSPGHQSLICRLKDRDLVISGDAIYEKSKLEAGASLPGSMYDEHNYKRSLGELRRFHQTYPSAEITAGHETAYYENAPEVWE
ncbi:MAG: N-acyl homoserine lactonase family protein [Solirubrobacterales bacterium]|nr:N-acyl homoserine lactonase family protein [Solirubrobacterales bacterium]MCB8915972.1 N-acyl homoserine lactonase family protein [Thermoleophilales bacterium]